MEKDCSSAIRLVRGEEKSLKSEAALDFCLVSVSYVNWVTNKPADILTKYGLSLGQEHGGVEESPICTWEVVLADFPASD